MKKWLLLTFLFFQPVIAHADFEEGEDFFEKQDYTRAFSEFLPLANSGDFRSQYYIGYLYINGLGVNQDVQEGIKYLNKSLEQDYDMAQSMMAFLYEEGHALPQNKKKALELYKKAAEQNNASANLNLGVMYYNGSNVPKDNKKALDYFKKVPLSEKPIVGRYMAEIYLNDTEFKNVDSALQYYKYAAQQGDLDSYYALGEIYRLGNGVPASKSEAFLYYQYAASKGYAPAQYMLGIMYVNGEGTERDLAKGHAWLTLASEQKFVNAEVALEKLSETMTITDFDKSRAQITQLQGGEMDKIQPPKISITPLTSTQSAKGTSVGKSKKRRRGSRAIRRD